MGDESKRLSAEGKDVDFNESRWKLFNSRDLNDVPHQENGCDCGVFTIMYADFLTDNLPFSFSQADMALFRGRICAAMLRGNVDYPTDSAVVPTSTDSAVAININCNSSVDNVPTSEDSAVAIFNHFTKKRGKKKGVSKYKSFVQEYLEKNDKNTKENTRKLKQSGILNALSYQPSVNSNANSEGICLRKNFGEALSLDTSNANSDGINELYLSPDSSQKSTISCSQGSDFDLSGDNYLQTAIQLSLEDIRHSSSSSSSSSSSYS